VESAPPNDAPENGSHPESQGRSVDPQKVIERLRQKKAEADDRVLLLEIALEDAEETIQELQAEVLRLQNGQAS
jgi:hypothetical protein